MKFMDGFKPSLYIDFKILGVFISFVFVGEKSNSFLFFIFYFFVSLKMLLKKKKNFITILLIYLFFFER